MSEIEGLGLIPYLQDAWLGRYHGVRSALMYPKGLPPVKSSPQENRCRLTKLLRT